MIFSEVFHVRRFSIALALVALGVAAQPLSHAQVPVAAQVVRADLYPERQVSFPGGVTGLPDLTYLTVSGYRPLTLDLYLPPEETGSARPFVMYVHGGGWSGGTSRNSGAFENFPEVLASIAARGYVVASIHYRLSGEEPFPANIQDVKSAIRWLRTNAEEYGIDKSRGLVWGPSAGGHLAALAATSCGVDALEPAAPRGPGRGQAPPAETAPQESDCVQGLVAWYGLFNFEGARFPAGVFGCEGSDCDPEVLRLASPVTHIDPSDPPMLIIHGELDRTIPVEQAREFYRLLQEEGVESELIVMPDIGHSYMGEDHQATIEASNIGLQKTIEFIEATIGSELDVPGSVE